MKLFSLSIKLSLVLLIIVPLSSCKKYEEGPALSLRTKKARVANKWKIDHATDFEDNEVETEDYAGEWWEFTKDGEFIYWEDGNVEGTGNWEFVADKKAIEILHPTGFGNIRVYYTIIKLKNKEMILRDDDDEIVLVPAE